MPKYAKYASKSTIICKIKLCVSLDPLKQIFSNDVTPTYR